MTDAELNEIEARAEMYAAFHDSAAGMVYSQDVPKLLAEVRRLKDCFLGEPRRQKQLDLLLTDKEKVWIENGRNAEAWYANPARGNE